MRQTKDKLATLLNDNCTTLSYGLLCLLSQAAQPNRKWDTAGTTIPNKMNMNQERHALQTLDWSTHIHRRYDLKLCSSSRACETQRRNLFFDLFNKASSTTVSSSMRCRVISSMCLIWFELMCEFEKGGGQNNNREGATEHLCK